MEVISTRIPDVKLIKPKVFEDSRGFFMETWNARELARAGIEAEFVQDNHSFSFRHTLRGLHYQLRHPQGKLVRIIQGEVFDVAVDLRKNSPTFGDWVGVLLSHQNHHQLWVPPGFAHGFYVLSQSAHFLYKCTDYYSPGDEYSIIWDDPQLNIDWPRKLGDPIYISEKDLCAPAFEEVVPFFGF